MVRRLSMFIRTSEFQECLAEALASLDLTIAMQRFKPGVPTEVAPSAYELAMQDGQRADRLNLVESRVAKAALAEKRVAKVPNVIVCDLPREEASVLYKSVIGFKSVEDDEQSAKNLLKAFNAIAKPFRKRLSRPVWARDVVHGGEAHAYRDIGYSVGAADWVSGGGELMQDGVLNVRYSLQKPS